MDADRLGELLAVGVGGGAEQRPGVAGGEAALAERALDHGGEREQPDGVRHRGTASADAQRDRLVGEAEGVGEAGVGGGLVEGGEVGPLQVLDEGELERLAPRLGGRPEDGRDPGEPGEGGGAEPALPGDELEAVAVALHDDGLEDAVGADRVGEAGEGLGVEVAPRLLGVGADGGDRDLDELGVVLGRAGPGVLVEDRGRARRAAEQGVEAASEPAAAGRRAPLRAHHAARGVAARPWRVRCRRWTRSWSSRASRP